MGLAVTWVGPTVNERLREQLLGYALGALEESEVRALEPLLAADPALREELERIQQSLEPLAESYEEFTPPPGLAVAACAYVQEEAERLQRTHPGVELATTSSRTVGSGSSEGRWSLADWFVFGGVCAVAVALFFPAVVNSRFMAQITSCQNNERVLGISMVDYSEGPGRGCFPSVPSSGNRAFAGVCVPILCDQGMLTDPGVLVCPDSALARFGQPLNPPTLEDIDAATGDEVLIMQRMSGGSYAFSLGVIENGRLVPVRNQRRPTFAILADSPWDAYGESAHRHGRNILYEDLHIGFVPDLAAAELPDNPYFNRMGRCEAGRDCDDAVVAPSYFPPFAAPETKRLP